MPSFEEEAFERARKLSHSRPGGNPPHSEPPKPAPPKPAPPKPAPPKPAPPAPAKEAPPKAPQLMDTLFKNKDNSLIMLLLLLLMDEKTDPSLLFSLLYLLM